jgi:hypothetical protein
VIFRVTVGKYSIHGAFGQGKFARATCQVQPSPFAGHPDRTKKGLMKTSLAMTEGEKGKAPSMSQKLYLVGGFNHFEKYESQWEGLSHILWKIKFMFQTTNQ